MNILISVLETFPFLVLLADFIPFVTVGMSSRRNRCHMKMEARIAHRKRKIVSP